jgi:hypothetical protein
MELIPHYTPLPLYHFTPSACDRLLPQSLIERWLHRVFHSTLLLHAASRTGHVARTATPIISSPATANPVI